MAKFTGTLDLKRSIMLLPMSFPCNDQSKLGWNFLSAVTNSHWCSNMNMHVTNIKGLFTWQRCKWNSSVAGGHSTCHILLHSKVEWYFFSPCVAFVSLHCCDSQRSMLSSGFLSCSFSTHSHLPFLRLLHYQSLLFFLYAAPYAKCLSYMEIMNNKL